MKSTPILVCVAFIFSLASCTKELSRESPTHGLPNSGTFYATIDGQSWNGDSIQQAVVADGTLTITGVSRAGDALAIVLPGLQTGVYALNAQSAGYALFTNLQDTSNLYLSNSIADSSKAGGIVSLTICMIRSIRRFPVLSGSIFTRDRTRQPNRLQRAYLPIFPMVEAP